ncbi:RNA polymerase sigma factor [Acidovorax sp. Leaf78]|uniref:RNA polymerase sigma factor n=1 Tax=unclassified Acidovorax TaxID=2684926 RepID=UPI001F471B44|nr:RNA polymerase sigma factor [Acidovorax sp. Leaf78]
MQAHFVTFITNAGGHPGECVPPEFPQLAVSGLGTDAMEPVAPHALADPSEAASTPLHEHEVVERDALFRTLVQAHGVRLHRFIIKNIGNSTDAEDLAQQAFLEAVRSYETFKGQSELSTWLYGIAMNLVRNHLSRAPHRRYEFTDESELSEMASDSLTPAQAVEQAQHMRYLEEAMAELPESMRDILLMVAVDELSYEDAAALLTVPVGTVRSRLSRARSALRAKLFARGVEFEF